MKVKRIGDGAFFVEPFFMPTTLSYSPGMIYQPLDGEVNESRDKPFSLDQKPDDMEEDEKKPAS